MTNHEWTGPTKAAEGMHSDLEFLARNISQWAEPCTYAKRDSDFSDGVCWSRSDKLDYGYGWITKAQWLQARKDLGLEDWHTSLTDSAEEAAVLEDMVEGVSNTRPTRTAESFLHEAADLMAERGKQYDQPGGERSMGKAVAALNAITGRDLTEAEGWLLMSLVKRVRQHSGAGYHKDSAEDAVAYAALEAEALEAGGD